MHFFEKTIHNFGQIDYRALPWVVLALIGLALVFDFLNGLHDAANSIATIVSTRVLTPQQAVIWAAFFNFVAFLVFNLSVAGTIGTGIINPGQASDAEGGARFVTQAVIGGALIGACAWNILTWYLGLPTSSSHALIGGLVGASFAHTGLEALMWNGIIKTCVFIIIAPLIGLVTGLGIAVVVFRLFRYARPRSVDSIFRKGQLLSAAAYSLGHGGNDAQKTMGIILLLLIMSFEYAPQAFPAEVNAANVKKMEVPLEVVLGCHIAMGLGTLMGGWRIVKTMGQRIIRLRPVDGFCAESGAAFTLILTLLFGIPVSTTQTITGAIVGVGTTQRLTAVRWGVAGRVVWAWILTIPGAATVAGICVLLFEWMARW